MMILNIYIRLNNLTPTTQGDNTMTTTTDLTKFGQRELKMLERTLYLMRVNGLPEDFNNDEVVPMFNMNSGCVFLTNSDYQVAMCSDSDNLESFYHCSECGHEGFAEDFQHNEDNEECQEQVKQYIGER